MIHLYIKTHNKTGLKYFGKTERVDAIEYLGSGVRWRKHLKKHGNDIRTEIIASFDNKEECSIYAEEFSKKNKIVESDEWANLIIENGKDGAPKGNVVSGSTKDKISKSLLGKKSPKSKYFMKESKEERSDRCRKSSTGTYWITDGKTDKRSKSVPEGWIRGRSAKLGSPELGKRNLSGSNLKGKKIYNNGQRHAYYVPGTEPNGWTSGKMEGYQGGTGSLRKGKRYAKRKKA